MTVLHGGLLIAWALGVLGHLAVLRHSWDTPRDRRDEAVIALGWPLFWVACLAFMLTLAVRKRYVARTKEKPDDGTRPISTCHRDDES